MVKVDNDVLFLSKEYHGVNSGFSDVFSKDAGGVSSDVGAVGDIGGVEDVNVADVGDFGDSDSSTDYHEGSRKFWLGGRIT